MKLVGPHTLYVVYFSCYMIDARSIYLKYLVNLALLDYPQSKVHFYTIFACLHEINICISYTDT